jgi:hypothetical protein
MSKKNQVQEPKQDITTAEAKSSSASIAWAITIGVLFGAVIGALVGVSLRPKKELAELSHEWLEEFRDVTERVSGKVRHQVRELVSKKLEPISDYDDYSESVV